MLFVCALTMLLTLPILLGAEYLTSTRGSVRARWGACLLWFTALSIPAALMLTPFLLERPPGTYEGSGNSGAQRLWWLFGSGAVLAMLVYGVRLHLQRSEARPGFFAVGANVAGILMGSYVAWVVADQLMFFATGSGDVGMIPWSLCRQQYAVGDIECDSEILLVSDTRGAAVRYRCPRVPAIVLGRGSATPFVAWPGYTEGSSPALATALHGARAPAQADRCRLIRQPDVRR